jgi:hypothetical protein
MPYAAIEASDFDMTIEIEAGSARSGCSGDVV